MTYKETGWYAFHHRFCVYRVNEDLALKLKKWPGAEGARYVLLYGCLDWKESRHLEVLAVGQDQSAFADSDLSMSITIPLKAVENEQVLFLDDFDGSWSERYNQKLTQLHGAEQYDRFPLDTCLKQAIAAWKQDHTRLSLDLALRYLCSCSVFVFGNRTLSDEGLKTFEKLDGASGNADMQAVSEFVPVRFTDGEGIPCIQVFTALSDIRGSVQEGYEKHYMPFAELLQLVRSGQNIAKIIVNPFTDNFHLTGPMLERCAAMRPLVPRQDALTLEKTTEPTAASGAEIVLKVGRMDVFNFALYHNRVAPVHDIMVQNTSASPIDGLTLRISADYNFFHLYEQPLMAVPPGKPIRVPDPKLLVHGSVLAELNEALDTLVTVEVLRDGACVAFVRKNMHILAYDQWMGSFYRNYLPAFCMPNHPVQTELLKQTIEYLKRSGINPSIDDYQSVKENPNRPRELAAAAWKAIHERNIVYATAPASWELGQRIRTPELVLEHGIGNCMEMSLLYAAALEQMGLHALLYVVQGHIFAGFWLENKDFGKVCIDGNGEIVKRMARGSEEIVLVECTALCSGGPEDMAQAEYHPGDDRLSAEQFLYAIDVHAARMAGVRPIPARVLGRSDAAVLPAQELPEQQTAADEEESHTFRPKISTKRDLWETRLLELHERNILLKLPRTGTVLPIMSSRIDELEDILSTGKEFRLQCFHPWLQSEQGKGYLLGINERIRTEGPYAIADWPADENGDLNEMIRQDYKNRYLYSFCSTAAQLDKQLTAIYRADRSSQQENGVSNLYMAIGLLKWYPEQISRTPNYAPLILVPVELIRRSASRGYTLKMRDEEARFNMTLLELLKQNYNIELQGLDPLPADEKGLDIRKIFAIVRKAMFEEERWDVVETCALGNFSFARFALWNDVHSAGEQLEGSHVVRSLMKGCIDWDTEEETQEEQKLMLPIALDDTQLQAVKAASAGSTFVLHGPPGTGKSQTITAMIANLMAQGKHVLFVAEKMAALSVVQRRLDALGIGDFCLELHANKANKKQVLSQLDRALHTQYPSGRAGYTALSQQTEQAGRQLDEYAEHLYAIQRCGMSMHELVDRYLTVADEPRQITFRPAAAADLTAEMLQQHEPLIHRLRSALGVVGSVGSHPLRELDIADYSAGFRFELEDAAESYRSAVTAMGGAAEGAARLMGTQKPENLEQLEALAAVIARFRELKNLDIAALTPLLGDLTPAYRALEAQQELKLEREQFDQLYTEEALHADLEGLLIRHAAAAKKLFGKNNAMKAVAEQCRHYTRFDVDYDSVPIVVSEINRFLRFRSDCEAALAVLPGELRGLLLLYPDEQELTAARQRAEADRARADAFPGGQAKLQLLKTDPEAEAVFAAFDRAYSTLKAGGDTLNSLLHRQERLHERITPESELALCDLLTDNSDLLKDWGQYCSIRRQCVQVGLTPVVEALEKETVSGDLIRAYRKGLYYGLINNLLRRDDVLSCFSGATFNESIRQFGLLDQALMEKARQEIYFRLILGKPSDGDSPETGRELSLLRKAIGSSRGLSIRELFARIPNVLYRLCPCMLMSPNSVAQYLPRINGLFDVVIFDEASQLPTCKAVGALLRADAAVIVGDPKQMPPTTFFAGSGPEVEDLALDDLDSILEDALALGIPSCYLKWHYRSTHESLIAFSNHTFYENRMYTFPSANDRERRVTAVHVDGRYHNGTNPREAEAIVAEIIRRFSDPELREQSIGVVTFNIKQKDMIENLLARQFEQNRELDSWANDGEDPLFVKNLENVQGDERDVILFSVGFGPDERGTVSMNFGPIAHAGGEKRLNVAFSRARVEMMVFETLRSSDIRITESTPAGTVAFHDFLRYAEGHDLQTDAVKSGDSQADGIAGDICRVLEAAGWTLQTRIGHSDFRIDIAVVDPCEPTRYLLGILLDAETYRDTANTRDRELSQSSVLSRLGWQLHRIWTMDWWDSRSREIEALLSRLEQLKEQAAVRQAQKQEQAAARQEEEEKRQQAAQELKARLEQESAQVEAEINADREAEAPGETAGQQPEPVSEQPEPVTQVPEPAPEPASEPQPEEPAAAVQQTPEAEAPEEAPPEPRQEETTAPKQALTAAAVLQQLVDDGIECIDNRAVSGILWLVGGEELQPVMTRLQKLGLEFTYMPNGAKSTSRRPAWRAQTDIELEL